MPTLGTWPGRTRPGPQLGPTNPVDWVIFHDKPVPRRHRHPILGDEKARNGADAPGARPLHVHLDDNVQHQQLGAVDVLRRDRQVHCTLVAACKATTN